MRPATHLVTCAAMAAMAGLSAQTPPAFEVASIRRTTSGNQQGAGLAAPQPGGRFVAIGATLRLLVSGAYDGMQIIGGPAWTDSDRFDINARASRARVPPNDMRTDASLAPRRSLQAGRAHRGARPAYLRALSSSQRSPTRTEASRIRCGVREGSAQLRARWAGRTSRVW